MCDDEEETWQVAGRRRRRVSNFGGDGNPQQQQYPPKVVVQTRTRDRASNGNADRKRKPRHRSTGGYSYTKNSSGEPIEASEESRVQEELRKIEKVKGLLRGTTLWKRVVDGLASILPQLGLTVPLPSRETAESITEAGVSLIATKDGESCPVLRLKEDNRNDDKQAACCLTAGGPTLSQGGQAAGAARVETDATNQRGIEERGTSVQTAPPAATCGAAGAGVWNQSLIAGEGRLDSSPAREVGKGDRTEGRAGVGVALRELVCYGIGNFSESHASRYQLALALCLRDLLFATTSSSSSTSTSSRDDDDDDDDHARNSSRRNSGEQVQTRHLGGNEDPASATMMTATATSTPNASQDWQVRDAEAAPATATATATAPPAPPRTAGPVQSAMLVFDPVMGDAERAILAALGCDVLNTNEEGKRCCCASVERGREQGSSRNQRTPTLFFMPHCPQRLYSNLLWANWSSPALGSMIILGNKLSAYADREVSGQALADPSNAILRAAPLLQEVQLQPYRARDKGRWREDVERLPHAEVAFNDLTLSYSCPEARGSVEGTDALLNRPLEFLEEVNGELVTGRATNVSGS